MKLRRIFTDNPAFAEDASSGRNFPKKISAGFTIVEILVVISIFGVILGISLPFGMDFYRSYLFRSEKSMLVSVLQKARSQSMNNIGEVPHGVHIDEDGYTIFQGTSFDSKNSANEFIVKNPSVSVFGTADIVFEQLTGNPNPPFGNGEGTTTLSDGIHKDFITINNEGRINY